MAWSSRWWRSFGAALSALMLALLTFGPGLDAILCQDDDARIAVAAAEQIAASTAGTDLPNHGEDGLSCVHGHCHHGASHVPAQTRPAELQAQPRIQHALERTRVPVSDPKFELNRPPRA